MSASFSISFMDQKVTEYLEQEVLEEIILLCDEKSVAEAHKDSRV